MVENKRAGVKVNIDNVVLVRAMNNLPLNGELVPSCEGKRLVNDHKSEFYYFVRRCVKSGLEQKLGRELVLYPDSPDYELMESVMRDYSILTGDYYTTTLSFSLNGLVPDDINNQFTNMKLAVLEPIKNQTKADFVTIETIDTTVKGRMKLSDEAMLVVEHEFFSQLSKEEQANLMSHFKIKLFEGDLKDAINSTLSENGYPVLPLIQKREKKNIEECPEKESILDFEDKFSVAVGASRLRLQQLTFMYGGGDGVDAVAHDKLSEEHDNNLKVEDYYKNQLYDFMLKKAATLGIEISDEDKYYLFTDFQTGTEVMQQTVVSLINAYGGLENFQQFIIEYNNYVKNNYLTNQQIIETLDNKKKN